MRATASCMAAAMYAVPPPCSAAAMRRDAAARRTSTSTVSPNSTMTVATRKKSGRAPEPAVSAIEAGVPVNDWLAPEAGEDGRGGEERAERKLALQIAAPAREQRDTGERARE